MILKIISRGFCLHPGSYIRDLWNVLDFVVVVGALLSYVMQATTTTNTNLSFIKTLRVLRVLRPLKTINKIPKLKSVVDCLINSLFNVYNILLVYMLFQTIFACMGVQLFAGKFNYCNDESINSSVDCRGNFTIGGGDNERYDKINIFSNRSQCKRRRNLTSQRVTGYDKVREHGSIAPRQLATL